MGLLFPGCATKYDTFMAKCCESKMISKESVFGDARGMIRMPKESIYADARRMASFLGFRRLL